MGYLSEPTERGVVTDMPVHLLSAFEAKQKELRWTSGRMRPNYP
jgi:hypothetical protein